MLVMTSASTFIQLSKAWFYLAKYLSLILFPELSYYFFEGISAWVVADLFSPLNIIH